MSIPRRVVLGTLFVMSLGGCEKASAPPPEAATAPAETAPLPSATSPVVETTPSTGAPEPTPTAASAPVIPPAGSAPGATPTAGTAPTSSVAPVAGGASSAATHGASHAPKEHAEAPASTANASPAVEGPTSDDACQTKNFHYTQVASACKSGGRKAVKAIMKGVIKKAKAAGTDLQCTSCHQDMKDFHLKSNAVGDLKNWL